MAGMVKLLTGAYARWVVSPPAPDRPCIYFANHSSNLDFITIWSALPPALRLRTRPAAALDYWSRGVIRPYLARQCFRAVLIERQKVTRTNNPIDQLQAVLAAGESIIIFPEGTRQTAPGAPLGEFKSGLYHLAQRQPEAVLIPVYLENLNRVLPKGEWLPVPMLCSVTFGPALPRLPGEDKTAFLNRARDAIHALRHP